MILDTLKNVSCYYSLNSGIEKALKYIQSNDLAGMQNGKYEIGENVFIIIQDYDTKAKEHGKWEAHKKYIDIQLIISGKEQLGCVEVTDLKISEQYNDENDIMFLVSEKKHGNFFNLDAGDFAIFYPQDAHMPGLSVDKIGHVKKAVVKILVEKS